LDFVNIARELATPNSVYAGVYANHLYPAHNVLHLFLVYLLSFPLGIEIANKLFFSVYVVGFALGLDYLLRVLRANRWLGLLGFLFIHSFSFFWGFPGIVVAFPLSFFVLALGIEWLDGSGRSNARWVLMVVLWALAFLAHALSFGLILLLFCVVLLVYGRGRRTQGQVGLLMATVLPAVALLVIPWLLTVGPAVRYSPASQLIESYRRSSPLVRLARIDSQVGSRDALSRFFFNLVPLAIMLRVIFAARRAGLSVLTSRPLAAASCLALVCFACYLFLPARLGAITVLSDRFAAFGYAFLTVLLAVMPGFTGSFRKTIPPAVVAVLLFNTANITWRFIEFDRVARPGLRMIAAMPAGKSVIGLVYTDAGLGIFGYPVLLHFASYYPALRGGYAGYTIAQMDYSPVRLVGTREFLKLGEEVSPWKHVFPQGWQRFEFILVRGAPRSGDSVYIDRCSRITSEGTWSLYAVPHAAGTQRSCSCRIGRYGDAQGEDGTADGSPRHPSPKLENLFRSCVRPGCAVPGFDAQTTAGCEWLPGRVCRTIREGS